MKVSVNLDAKTADLFNLLRGDRSIGAFALECITQQLTTLNRGNDGKRITIQYNKTSNDGSKQG